MVLSSLGLVLKFRRLEKRLNQLDLARFCGVTERQISAYETGRAKPSPEVLAKLEKLLGPLEVTE